MCFRKILEIILVLDLDFRELIIGPDMGAHSVIKESMIASSLLAFLSVPRICHHFEFKVTVC